MRLCLFLIASIFIAGCMQNTSETDYPSSPKSRLANEISKQVALQLKKEQDLYPCGFGGGMMHQIRMLALSFNYYKPVNIEQGREMLMAAGSLFLKTINENDEIRPYLDTYPFLPKNIEIRIFLMSSDGSLVDPGKLYVISLIDDVLRYQIDHPETKKLTTIYSETYEEAAEKLNLTVNFVNPLICKDQI
jgi:hypothetical protein